MFKLYWKERMPDGSNTVKSKVFSDREERFRFILKLERNPFFVKVLEA